MFITNFKNLHYREETLSNHMPLKSIFPEFTLHCCEGLRVLSWTGLGWAMVRTGQPAPIPGSGSHGVGRELSRQLGQVGDSSGMRAGPAQPPSTPSVPGALKEPKQPPSQPTCRSAPPPAGLWPVSALQGLLDELARTDLGIFCL